MCKTLQVEGALVKHKLKEKGDPCQLDYEAQHFFPTIWVNEGKVKVQQAYACGPCVCVCACSLNIPNIFI